MNEFFSDYGLFLAKTVTVVAAAGLLIALAAGSAGRRRSPGRLEVRALNRHLDELRDSLQAAMLPRRKLKRWLKSRRKQEKRADRRPGEPRRRVFVLGFHGDLRASAVSSLREEISAVITTARPEDEVLLRLESYGGLVHSYGLAASQLVRLKSADIRLTVAIDRVAASGGYLMACVADRILAAPFAVLGSIGVIAQLPNFHRLLDKHQVDFEQFKAGEFKRTVTVFGENTDADRAKFQEEIEQTHELFKAFVSEHRPTLDLQQVATGEHWYGRQALELKLLDELRTSDDYLLEASRSADIYELRYRGRRHWMARLMPTEGEGEQARMIRPMLAAALTGLLRVGAGRGAGEPR
jgi:serine protease SohB